MNIEPLIRSDTWTHGTLLRTSSNSYKITRRGMRSRKKSTSKAKKRAGVDGKWRYEITSQILQSSAGTNNDTVGGVDPYAVREGRGVTRVGLVLGVRVGIR